MPNKPRLIDLFPTKPKRRRPLVTQDGRLIARDETMPASCIGEALPIWGEPIAMDARPRTDRCPVTFDGALPDTRKHSKDRHHG